MTEVAAGILEVGINDSGEVVVNHPDLNPDDNGVGHIVFSPSQARNLAFILQKKAHEAEEDLLVKREADRIASLPPVDRTAKVLVSGDPVPEDWSHTEITANGQQKDYVVLTPEERSKGFVRPVRRAYKHVPCGSITTMALPIAETMARDPRFYQGGFCATCRAHFPNDQFVWPDDGSKVGS